MSVTRQLERETQKSLPIKFLSLEISQSALCAAQMRMKNEKKNLALIRREGCQEPAIGYLPY
jgi:hypothetical protein